MRKILRKRMRTQAEIQDGKTIKVFRKMWKNRLESKGVIIPKQRRKKSTKKYAW